MKKALIALLMGFMALPAIATNTNSIVENLQELIEARDAITNAIVERGGSVISGALKDVPQEILDIPDPPSPTPPVLIDKTITTNGYYLASEDNADGYNEVTVNVSGGGGGPLAAIVSRQSSPTYTVSASDLAGATSIGYSAFNNCSGLTSVTIPDSVRSIGDYAFFGCSGLMSIDIPDSVTNIGTQAFSTCSGLETVTIPDSVTSIGVNAFNGCSGLLSVTMPDSVMSIKAQAFSGCSNLAIIDFGPTRTTIPTLNDANAFNNIAANYQIWVPGEQFAAWKITENWTNLASHICPCQAIDGGECVTEGNGVSIVGGGFSGTFDANTANNLDPNFETMGTPDSTLWIGDSITAIDDSGFEGDLGVPMYNDGGNDGCWGYLKFCNIPQEEVETWSGYPWGFPTNRISYLSRPE